MKKWTKCALAVIMCLLIMTGCNENDVNKAFNTVNDLVDLYNSITSDKNESFDLNQSVDELIQQVEIEEANESKYDRSEWTSSYQNYEFNGQKFSSIRDYAYYASVWYDEKNDQYIDPYNGKILNSVKETDYDHLIPLHYANMHGADEWTEDEKRAYADDPMVGVDVNSHDNRAKSDKGPSEWLPDENVEDYCYTWLVIAVKYDLSMDQDDMNTIKQCLDGVDESELDIINEYK